MKGVILAGGKGTRLRPLTCNLPKPMMPLLNRPVMEYSLELLKAHGIEEIAITVQYMSTAIKNYFGDGSRWGVKLYYFEDSPPLGTAGSIKQAESFLDEPFVVISGDALTDFNLSKGIDFHNSADRLVTMFLKEVSHPLDFGLAVTNEDSRIVKYIEKPSWNEVISNTVNTGIYIMDPAIFSYMEEHTFCDFSHDIFPLLLEQGAPVFGYLSEGYWLDIGTFPQYRQAHFDLLLKKVSASIEHTEILPAVWLGEGVVIEEGTKVSGPALIGDGAVIKSGAVVEPYSIIGKHSTIGENAHIGKSIIWNDVYIGKHCELTGAIIASGTVIEDDSTLFEKSIVADHCRLGKNTVVKAKVKVWPGREIDSGSVLVSSVISDSEEGKAASLFSKGSITGRANIDMTPERIVKLAEAYGSTLPVHASVLIGSDGNAYSRLLKRIFISSIHATGIHTLECQETNDSCFRYAVSEENVTAGVFFYMPEHAEERIMMRFYDESGFLITTRKEKEIETVYLGEAYRHVSVLHIGTNTNVSVCEKRYVNSVLSMLNTAIIQERNFRLLINKSDSSFYSAALSFFQFLGCEITWMYSSQNEDHIKLLMQSSCADIAIIFSEQGNTFELYDAFGNIYTSMGEENIYIPEMLLQRGETGGYPLCIKRESGYITCYVEQSMPEISIGSANLFGHDALFRIGKLLEIMASQQISLHAIFENYPNFHLLWDEVLCPWKEKGKIMRMLLQDVEKKEFELHDGIKFDYEDGEWSYIVSDSSQPKIMVYSHSLNPTIAKEKITYLIEKIRQYQKV
ncbi:MAG: sugar phosphate nucleotidyltransferase [Ectobacillus sp.]